MKSIIFSGLERLAFGKECLPDRRAPYTSETRIISRLALAFFNIPPGSLVILNRIDVDNYLL